MKDPLLVFQCMKLSLFYTGLGICHFIIWTLINCLSASLLRMICLIVWSIFSFREGLSITAVVLWLFSMDAWWSLEQRSSTLTGETEALQCHCFWMNLAAVGESASCQNIWVRPHTVFKIVIVGLFLGILVLTVLLFACQFHCCV